MLVVWSVSNNLDAIFFLTRITIAFLLDISTRKDKPTTHQLFVIACLVLFDQIESFLVICHPTWPQADPRLGRTL